VHSRVFELGEPGAGAQSLADVLVQAFRTTLLRRGVHDVSEDELRTFFRSEAR